MLYSYLTLTLFLNDSDEYVSKTNNNSIQFCYNNLWLRCQCIVDEKICFEAQNN